MKRKKNLEQNISRLVKTTSDSDRPSEEFTANLIDDALAELKNPRTDQPRSERNRRMKIKWTKTISWAAVLMIVGLGATALLMPSMNKVKKITQRTISQTDEARINTTRVNQLVEAELQKSRLEIEAKEFAKRINEPPVLFVETSPKALHSPAKPSPKIVNSSVQVQTVNGNVPKTSLDIAGGTSTKYYARGGEVYYNDSRSGLTKEPAQAMAHGGNTPPNSEAHDAMFFKNYGVNPFVDTEDDHLSTFATDVDTGSYTVCRRYLLGGNLPPNDAVRVEELVNYFNYGYGAPQEDTFAVYTEAIPWSGWTGRQNSYLVRFGLKAKEISDANRKPAILTFVIDVSGSMNRENRLGLVKKSLKMLVKQLRPKDKIGIAVYGSQGRKVLDHVNVKKKRKILDAIESLESGGSTFAEDGIRIGYEMADEAYKEGYINRVILCSDGVANVGQTGHEQILAVIKDKADKGITLSALGFGMGNYNDVLMERLGDKGNGYYAYIDTIDEAKRLFAENLTGSLQVVARDVKIQVDFNPKVVRSYRLIGYENRDVADDKFRDDKEDGGEMGAGHSTTALYELKLWDDKAGDVATTYVRYKHPDTKEVTEFNTTLATADFHENPDQASDGFALAKTVTEFAEILRESYWAKGKTLDNTLAQAKQLSVRLEDNSEATELTDLIKKAKKLIDQKTNQD